MAQLYLPAEHTEADLVLAGQIAETMDSAELYVAWTPETGQSSPAIPAELREPVAHWTDSIALVIQAVRELWAALLGREHRPAQAQRSAGELPSRRKPAAGEAAA